ncbi:hypothetical protein Ae706Ps2_1211 [Pseudonocardia sp. Ae706_Ps2]|nr:hypothetical protein Ae331Ps2_4712c [Pseudonocardia sp. Ae331_Ps2]OLM22779.1 hypothetical protein Ae706Ps2_1211 [Pseudonocardia sp. Ae706_Ps2]
MIHRIPPGRAGGAHTRTGGIERGAGPGAATIVGHGERTTRLRREHAGGAASVVTPATRISRTVVGPSPRASAEVSPDGLAIEARQASYSSAAPGPGCHCWRVDSTAILTSLLRSGSCGSGSPTSGLDGIARSRWY